MKSFFTFCFLFLVAFSARSQNEIHLENVIRHNSQIHQEGNRYVVNSVFDLKGQTLILPKNSILSFSTGGRIVNGIVKGQFSEINNPQFNNIHFLGTFINEEIVIADSSFGKNPDFWGILSSFSNVTIVLKTNLFPDKCPLKDFKCSNLKIVGNGHTIRVHDFPIFRGAEVKIDNVIFDCGEATEFVLYSIGKGNTFEITNCQFLNIPKIKHPLCPRAYSKVCIENNIFKGKLQASSSRSSQFSSCILLYECSGIIHVKNNDISSCFGTAINGIGFTKEKNTKILVENNSIDRVSNGGIVFTGGDVWNVTVRDNRISNTHYLGNQFPKENNGGPNSAINFHGFHNVVVENNIISNCQNSSCFDFDGSLSGKNTVEKGSNLLVKGNTISRTCGAALYVVEDVLFENNVLETDKANISQSIISVSGSKNIRIHRNHFHLSKGSAKTYYPLYISDTGSVGSGLVSISGNEIYSDDKHFVFINSRYTGNCKIGKNSIKKSGRADGTLFIVNNSKTKVDIPKKSKFVKYK